MKLCGIKKTESDAKTKEIHEMEHLCHQIIEKEQMKRRKREQKIETVRNELRTNLDAKAKELQEMERRYKELEEKLKIEHKRTGFDKKPLEKESRISDDTKRRNQQINHINYGLLQENKKLKEENMRMRKDTEKDGKLIKQCMMDQLRESIDEIMAQ